MLMSSPASVGADVGGYATGGGAGDVGGACDARPGKDVSMNRAWGTCALAGFVPFQDICKVWTVGTVCAAGVGFSDRRDIRWVAHQRRKAPP
eukprot:6174717-Pleurochrysis_carterae.AAC.1